MKTCPFCAEQIQDAAVVCKHCGRDLEGGAAQVQIVTPKKKMGVAGWGCLTLIGLFGFLWLVGALTGPRPESGSSSSASRSTASSASPTTFELVLLSSRAYAQHGYHIVEGQVRNISGGTLENVTAVVSWYGPNAQFITSDDALIEFNPILADQISPFKTMTTTNPAMLTYEVQFKTLLGGSLRTRYDPSAK